MTDPLIVQLEGGVLTVTLNTPEDHNRMDRRMMTGLYDAMDRADGDSSVRVLVVTGAGEYFCAGGRVDGHPHGTLKQRQDYAQAYCQMQDRFGRLSVPTIAAVNGHCIAGGMSLMSFCDLAIAAEDAEFGYPEVKYGQFPALALAMLIPVVPQKRAFEMLYFGDRFSAQQALALNLVNRIAPRAELDEAVGEFARVLIQRNQTAIGMGRKAYYAMTPMTPASRLQYAQQFLMALLQATDGFVPAASEDDRIGAGRG
jgi:enoyl-CoA hydratase/carnithine racemase